MTEPEPTALDIKFTQRFSTNLISNILYFVLNLVIGIALAPFFLDTLGQSAYGLIPLATSVSSYVTLLISSVNSSVSRFLTVDLQKGDISAANKTFNTALFGTLVIVLILVPVALLVSFFSPQFFNIGSIAATDVMLLFALVLLSVLIRAWSSNFMVTLFANNRLDLRNWVENTNLVVQVGLIVLLFALLGSYLVYVGLAYFVASLAAFTLACILSRRVCPYLSIRPAYFVCKKFKEIGDVALWMGFNILGGLFYSQIGLMVVNIFMGEISGTQYSLCLVWGGVLISISGLVTNTFTPKIYAHYAADDREGLLKFTSFTIKIVGLFMVLPIALIYVFLPELFTIWVGAEYAVLTPIVWILLLPILTQMQAACIAPINAAYKRVRVPEIANFIAGIMNLSLALLLSQAFGMGMYGVAVAYAVSMFFLTGLVSPLYNAYVVGAPRFLFIKQIVSSMLILGGFVGVGMVITFVVPGTSFVSLLMTAVPLSLGYAVFALFGVLKESERKMIRACLPAGIERRTPSWLL